MKQVYAIIANHNYGEYVGNAIKSALNQSYPTGVVVFNDGSSDDSEQRILESLFPESSFDVEIQDDKTIYYKDNRIFINSKNCLGASEARNVAINLVWDKADYFLILDADDEAYKNKVQRMLEAFKFPGVGVVYGDYHIYNTEKNITVPEYKKPFDLHTLQYDCIVHSQSLISKEALSSVLENGKVYDASLHRPKTEEFQGCSEDWDLWLRISEKWMIYHIPEFLSLVRVTGKNQSTPANVTPEIYTANVNHMRQKAKVRHGSTK